MPRRLRIEFEGAIYHVMARGNARQDIVHDDDDRRRLRDDLARATVACGWQLVSYVVMSNHLHLLLKTPQPNLARGMQRFLSSYALWCARRRRRPGHLFQGRYRAEMVEDETYYWTVSRYIHLNPVRAEITERPEAWPWSSYPGYTDPARRHDWVSHEALLTAWRGEFGGGDPAAAYRRFVQAGVERPPVSPFREAFGGWVLGSAGSSHGYGPWPTRSTTTPSTRARRPTGLDAEQVCQTVASYYGLDRSVLGRRGEAHIARPVAAWLCRRHTEAPLRVLAEMLGLSRADSVPNLTRRVETRLRTSPKLAEEMEDIVNCLIGKTKNKV